MFATLDLMTGGRSAWNVVTSINDGEALNMGIDAHMAHHLRYDRADVIWANLPVPRFQPDTGKKRRACRGTP